MAKKLQILRGTTAQNDAYTGSIGELTMDTEKVEVRIHDGITQGGKKIGSGGANLPILTHVFSDHIINDISWLRADTFSWHSGDVYVAAYNHLVDDFENVQTTTYYAWEHEVTGNVYYTTTLTPSAGDKTSEGNDITSAGTDYIIVKGANCYRDPSKDNTIRTKTLVPEGAGIWCYIAPDGHRIVDASDTVQVQNVIDLYEATGVAWYYILDTTNKQFKLPRTKWGFTGLRDSVGGYVAQDVLLPNITGVVTGIGDVSVSGAFARGSKVSGNGGGGGSITADSFKASRSSSVYSGDGTNTLIQPRGTQMYLYFYVGNFEQSAVEQTAGLNAEMFNDLNAHRVIEAQVPTADNGYTWYRKYADGWVEQGGHIDSGVNTPYTVSLPIEMSDAKYSITLGVGGATSSGGYNSGYKDKTTTSFMFIFHNAGTNGGNYGSWQVSGMAA